MTENFSRRNLSTSDENQNIELCKFDEPHVINQLENLKLRCDKIESVGAKHKKSKVKIVEPRYCKVCGKELNYRQHTYCSQKCAHKYVSKRPTKEDFITIIDTYKSNIAVGKYFGVSDSTICK